MEEERILYFREQGQTRPLTIRQDGFLLGLPNFVLWLLGRAPCDMCCVYTPSEPFVIKAGETVRIVMPLPPVDRTQQE